MVLRRIRGVGFAGMLAVLLLILSCGGEDTGTRGGLSTGDVPDQVFNDFTTTESDSGIVTWSLQAPVARIYNARKLLVTDSPTIEFYSEGGRLGSVLTAEKGEFNQVTHDLTALGNVVVTSTEGYKLETESLIWVDKLAEIHTEDFVRFTRGRDVLTGYGLTSDPHLRDVVIKRDVKAYLTDESGAVKEEMDRETGGRDDSDE
jgi:LPS export ABC transporter protein LptC